MALIAYSKVIVEYTIIFIIQCTDHVSYTKLSYLLRLLYSKHMLGRSQS